MPSMLSYPRRLPSGHITCYLNRTYHVLTTRCLISIDISPYVRLVWLRAQTPGMLDFYSAFVWAWLQPTRPSSLALALDWSTVLRPKFVQPGCTGEFVHPGCTTTPNRIPSSALIARDRLGRDAMRHTAGLASGFWTISDSRRQGFVGRATLCGILRN